jgi:zinc protease
VRVLAERYYGASPRKAVPQRVRAQEPPPLAARRVELRDARVRNDDEVCESIQRGHCTDS